MMRVLVTEFMDDKALGDFGSQIDVNYAPDLVNNRKRLLEVADQYDAFIVRNRTLVDGELIGRAKRLKAIGRLGVGLDNIDLKACDLNKIKVLPATGANASSVAEYVIASALILIRKTFGSNDQVLSGKWSRNMLGQGGEIAGRTMALVGFGATARETAFRAKALGMHVAAFDPHIDRNADAWKDVRQCSLNELFDCADVLSLHVPLIDSTKLLIDANAIKKLKDTAIVINTARGGIIDDLAVIAAIKNGSLGGAALDVFETEPMKADRAAAYKGVSNLILTPHIAGLTLEGNARVSRLTVQNVERALKL